MAQYLDEQQVAEFRDGFNLYDKKHNGRILCSDLVTVMRSLGACPTLTEVQNHLASIKKGTKDYLDFSQFLTIMYNQVSSENISEEIMQAFKISDSARHGMIPSAELRRILMKTGEKLSSREVDQMFRAANIQNNGYVKYKDFVTMVTIPIPDY